MRCWSDLRSITTGNCARARRCGGVVQLSYGEAVHTVTLVTLEYDCAFGDSQSVRGPDYLNGVGGENRYVPGSAEFGDGGDVRKILGDKDFVEGKRARSVQLVLQRSRRGDRVSTSYTVEFDFVDGAELVRGAVGRGVDGGAAVGKQEAFVGRGEEYMTNGSA